MDELYDNETLKRVQAAELQILKDVQEVCEKHDIKVFLVFGSALGVVRHQGFIPWDDDIDVAMFREDYVRFEKIAREELADKYEILNCETNDAYAGTVTHFQKKGTKFISWDSKDCDYEQGICVDIFVYDALASTKIGRKYQYFMTWFLGRLLYLSGKATPFIPYQGIKKDVAEFICDAVRKILWTFNVTPQKVYSWFKNVSQKYNGKSTGYCAIFETPKPWTNAMLKKKAYPMKKYAFEDMEVLLPDNTDWLLTKVFGNYMELPPEEKRVNHRPYKIGFGDE